MFDKMLLLNERKDYYVLRVGTELALLGSRDNSTEKLMLEWEGKKIIFPEKTQFALYGKDFVFDTIPDAEFKILTYVDSTGCASCKLRLPSWLDFIAQLDSMKLNVPILFYTLLTQEN